MQTAVKTDSPAIREALNSLSGFYDVSSAGQSRKELRHVLDQRAADVAEQFLSALAPFEQVGCQGCQGCWSIRVLTLCRAI